MGWFSICIHVLLIVLAASTVPILIHATCCEPRRGRKAVLAIMTILMIPFSLVMLYGLTFSFDQKLGTNFYGVPEVIELCAPMPHANF